MRAHVGGSGEMARIMICLGSFDDGVGLIKRLLLAGWFSKYRV